MPGVHLQVWQAILSKKVDLDSWKIKRSMSEPARNLLRVGTASALPAVWEMASMTGCTKLLSLVVYV